jgi:hypothetical protein
MKNMTPSPRVLTAADLMDAAIHGKPIDPLRALAAYADPSNWVQCYGGEDSDGNKLKPCEWAFIGPTRPGYELAQHTLSRLNDPVVARREDAPPSE